MGNSPFCVKRKNHKDDLFMKGQRIDVIRFYQSGYLTKI